MKLGVSLLSLLAMCSVGLADPISPCPAGTLQDYINFGSDGCILGSALFYNFMDSSSFLTTPGATEITGGSIQVIPFSGGLSPGLEFQVNATAGAGELLQARVSYTVGLPGPPLTFDLGMTGSSAVPDGVTTVVTEVCPGGVIDFIGCFDPNTFDLLPTQALILFDIGIDASLAESLLLPPLTTLGVLNDIVIDGGLAGSAAIGSATNQFSVVPEPGTFWSLSAVLACVWLRSRRRKRQ
jgi:hypothetical protein